MSAKWNWDVAFKKGGERVGAGKLSGITMQWRDWRFSPPRKSAFPIHLESFTGTMRSEMDWKSGLCATSRPYRARKFRMIDLWFPVRLQVAAIILSQLRYGSGDAARWNSIKFSTESTSKRFIWKLFFIFHQEATQKCLNNFIPQMGKTFLLLNFIFVQCLATVWKHHSELTSELSPYELRCSAATKLFWTRKRVWLWIYGH